MADKGFSISGELTEAGHRLCSGSITKTPISPALVYHARYLHFLERGRTDYLRCLGVEQRELIRPTRRAWSSSSTAWRSTSRRRHGWTTS
jgi:hypothetical protein